MLDEQKSKKIEALLRDVEKQAMQGGEKQLQKAMDAFNDFLEKLPEKQREYAFVESLPVMRKIIRDVTEQKEMVSDIIKDANDKNVANKAYSKF